MARARSRARPKAKSAASARPKPTPARKAKPVQPAKKSAPTAGKPKTKARPVRAKANPKRARRAESARGRALTARERARGSTGSIVEILDAPRPVEALRDLLAGIDGEASPETAQIALGAAQLLLPIAHEADNPGDAAAIVDLMLVHWEAFGASRTGFHAQELLREALTAVGEDRERIAQLATRVPPGACDELRHALAAAQAAVQPVPRIPVDLDPYLPGVRAAFDTLVATLDELGSTAELRTPVRLDAILDAERAGKLSLPNDYRALLTLSNGLRVLDHEFFGLADFREPTELAQRARRYVGQAGLDACVPIAAWGPTGEWIFYDPHGAVRADGPGYVLAHGDETFPVDDLASTLAHLAWLARDTLATN
jgi:hypothetical protein